MLQLSGSLWFEEQFAIVDRNCSRAYFDVYFLSDSKMLRKVVKYPNTVCFYAETGGCACVS